MYLQGGLPRSKKGICAHSHADGPASCSSIQLWSEVIVPAVGGHAGITILPLLTSACNFCVFPLKMKGFMNAVSYSKRIGLLNWRKFIHLIEKENLTSLQLTGRNLRIGCFYGMESQAWM